MMDCISEMRYYCMDRKRRFEDVSVDVGYGVKCV